MAACQKPLKLSYRGIAEHRRRHRDAIVSSRSMASLNRTGESGHVLMRVGVRINLELCAIFVLMTRRPSGGLGSAMASKSPAALAGKHRVGWRCINAEACLNKALENRAAADLCGFSVEPRPASVIKLPRPLRPSMWPAGVMAAIYRNNHHIPAKVAERNISVAIWWWNWRCAGPYSAKLYLLESGYKWRHHRREMSKAEYSESSRQSEASRLSAAVLKMSSSAAILRPSNDGRQPSLVFWRRNGVMAISSSLVKTCNHNRHISWSACHDANNGAI